MAYSQVGIVNLALVFGKAGGNRISAMTEDSIAAITASAVWDYVRDDVLSSGVPWNFAKERYKLAQDATAPTYGYDYRYAKPSSCLSIIEVALEDRSPVSYVEEGDYLLSDTDNTTEDIYINYIKVITDYAKWPAKFVNCFAWKLGAVLGTQLESIDQNDMLNKYQVALMDAMAYNQKQHYIADDTGSSSWEDAGR